VQQALQHWQLQVDVGAEVAVQALEGGEAVVFSHERVASANCALCAGKLGGKRANEAVFGCLVFELELLDASLDMGSATVT
jgi:hypothetical protein